MTTENGHSNKKPGKSRFHRTGGRAREAAGTSGRAASDAYIYGLHAAEFALHNPQRRITAIWATENAERKLQAALAERDLNPTRVSPRDLDRRVGPDAVHQGIVLEVEPLADIELQDIAERAIDLRVPVLMLDQVTDPQNVGAVLRSGAVFGAAGLIMTYRHSPPLGATLAKSASGALDLMPIARVQNLAAALDELKRQSFKVIGLDGAPDHPLLEDGLRDHANGPAVIVLGAEGKGLRELTLRSCDIICRISGDGPIASLNVSNAAAIALHLAAMLRRST